MTYIGIMTEALWQRSCWCCCELFFEQVDKYVDDKNRSFYPFSGLDASLVVDIAVIYYVIFGVSHFIRLLVVAQVWQATLPFNIIGTFSICALAIKDEASAALQTNGE